MIFYQNKSILEKLKIGNQEIYFSRLFFPKIETLFWDYRSTMCRVSRVGVSQSSRVGGGVSSQSVSQSVSRHSPFNPNPNNLDETYSTYFALN